MQRTVRFWWLTSILLIPVSAFGQDSLEYAAKFVCGRPATAPAIGTLAPGVYFTAINVHNPNRDTLVIYLKIAESRPFGAEGTITRFSALTLTPDGALGIDCRTILRALVARGFAEGYAVIQSRLSLDVVAVYTAGGSGGLVSAEDLDRIPSRHIVGMCRIQPVKNWIPQALPSTNGLHGVWGASANDVFAVGFAGTIVHYNGTTWSAQPNPAAGRYTLPAVWGTSSNNVWATAAPVDTLLHYDGASWSVVHVTGTRGTMLGLGGTSAADVFAVGNGGAIIHYDGTAWSAEASGTTNDLLGVWAASPRDAFAVGRAGTILHYDGTSWAPQSSGTTHDLTGVWGASHGEVFAVGEGGTILHYNGTGWTPQASGTTAYLSGVSGAAGCNVFVVGFNGTILHYDGIAWTPEVSATAEPLEAVWVAGWSNGVTVGGTVTTGTVRRRLP